LGSESMSSTIRFGGRRWCTLSIDWPGRSASAARFPGRLRHLASKRPIWLAEAADLVIARSADHPAHRRVAAEPLGVVHILVAGQPSKHRLAQTDQPVATVLPRCAQQRECRHPCCLVRGCRATQDRQATLHRTWSQSRETEVSGGGRNRASERPDPPHPAGPPFLPFDPPQDTEF
jgi:hypothetical protein